jgi:hypothetical protein
VGTGLVWKRNTGKLSSGYITSGPPGRAQLHIIS